jgi:hypothetical protein
VKVIISFKGRPGSDRDKQAEKIIKDHDGRWCGGGTFVATLERDIEAEIPDDKWQACKAVLEAEKFHIVEMG